MATRWNERRLRELAQEEGADRYRSRTGRMDKWRQVAREAAPEDFKAIEAPEQIRYLGEVSHFFCPSLPWTVLPKK